MIEIVTSEGEVVRVKMILGKFTPPPGRTGVLLVTEDGQPYAKLRLNEPKADIRFGDELIAKVYDENVGIVEQLIEQGWFERTGRICEVGPAGCHRCPILRIADKCRIENGGCVEFKL